jgi:hypothetical protein
MSGFPTGTKHIGTDTMDMLKLMARLKAVRGPDRVLDRDLARLATGQQHQWWHPCMSAWGKGVPHYTVSFEAALTLLPKAVYVEVGGSTDTHDPGVWPAVTIRWLPPGQTDPKKWWGTVQGGPSFALAMCLAAVEVRSRMTES